MSFLVGIFLRKNLTLATSLIRSDGGGQRAIPHVPHGLSVSLSMLFDEKPMGFNSHPSLKSKSKLASPVVKSTVVVYYPKNFISITTIIRIIG